MIAANEAAMVLDAVTEVRLFINVFVSVYLLAVFLYVLSSWLRLPNALSPVQRFLYDICEPYLRLWRRIVPMSFGPVDLTPMIAIFALIIVSQVVDALLSRL